MITGYNMVRGKIQDQNTHVNRMFFIYEKYKNDYWKGFWIARKFQIPQLIYYKDPQQVRKSYVQNLFYEVLEYNDSELSL